MNSALALPTEHENGRHVAAAPGVVGPHAVRSDGDRGEEEKVERRTREVRVGSWDGSSKNRLQVVFAKTKRILIFFFMFK